MRERINSIVKYLGLKKPVYITLTTRKHKENDGYYMPRFSDSGKLQSHRIKIYLGNEGETDRDINSLVAHELIHAWQQENKDNKIHGKKFAKIARKLTRKFVIPGIYRKDLDTP